MIKRFLFATIWIFAVRQAHADILGSTERTIGPMAVTIYVNVTASEDPHIEAHTPWVSYIGKFGTNPTVLEFSISENQTAVTRVSSININNESYQLSQQANYDGLAELQTRGSAGYGQLGGGVSSLYDHFTKIAEGIRDARVYHGSTLLLKHDNSLWFRGGGIQFAQIHPTNGNYISQEFKIADNVQAIMPRGRQVNTYPSSNVGYIYYTDNENTLWRTSLYGDRESVKIAENVYSTDRGVSTAAQPHYILYTNGELWRLEATSEYLRIATNVKTFEVNEKSFREFIIKNDHALWGRGYNDYLQLSPDLDTSYQTDFTKLDENVANVHAKQYSTFFLHTDGMLTATGKQVILNEQYVTPTSYPTKYSHVIGTEETTLYLRPNGKLDATGSILHQTNQFHSIKENIKEPTEIGHGFTTASSTNTHIIGLKSDGSLWAIGSNSSGEFITGTTLFRSQPVALASGVKKTVSGVNTTLYIDSENQLWGLGTNQDGQLGVGHRDQVRTPTPIATDVVDAFAASNVTLFIRSDRTLWGMGNNFHGQLGVSDPQVITQPTLVAEDVKTAKATSKIIHYITRNGDLWALGGERNQYNGRDLIYKFGLWHFDLNWDPDKDPFSTVDFPAYGNIAEQIGSNVENIAVDYYNFASLSTDGELYAYEPYTSLPPLEVSGIEQLFGWWKGGLLYRNENGSLTGDGYPNPFENVSILHARDVIVGIHTLYLVANDFSLWRFPRSESDEYNDQDIDDPVKLAPFVSSASISSYYGSWIIDPNAPKPQVLDQTPDAELFETDKVSLGVEADGAGPLTFQWFRNGEPIPEEHEAQILGTIDADDATTTFTVTVSNLHGSVTSKPILITRGGGIPLPTVAIKPSKISIAPGEVANFRLTYNNFINPTFQWYHQGKAIPGASESTLTLPSATLADTGHYRVIISSRDQPPTHADCQLEVDLGAHEFFSFRKAFINDRFIARLESDHATDGNLLVIDTETGASAAIRVFISGGRFINSYEPPTNIISLNNAFGEVIHEFPLNDLAGGFADLNEWQAVEYSPFSEGRIPETRERVYLIRERVGTRHLMVVANNLGAMGTYADQVDSRLIFTLPDGRSADASTVSPTIRSTDGTNYKIRFESTFNPFENDRLLNISARVLSQGNADKLAIIGFTISGDTPKDVLVRAVGRELMNHNIATPVHNPLFKLFKGSQLLAQAGEFTTSADREKLATVFEDTGAFPLTTTGNTAKLFRLPPGSYTAVAGDEFGRRGTLLLEVYDYSEPSEGNNLINISARANVETGDDVCIAGFVIGGARRKQILLRGVGPGLENYKVRGVLEDPKISVYGSLQSIIATNNDWDSDPDAAESVIKISTQVSAFPLEAGSKDAAIVVWLWPGLYSVVLSGSGGSTGVALVEVYEVN